MKKFKILLLFVTIVLLARLSWSATLEETYKKRMPAENIHLVALSNVNGRVDISSWDNNEIEIVAYKKIRASSAKRARELMDRLKIDLSETADGIDIETHMPRRSTSGDGFFAWLLNMSGSNAQVRYEIKVPVKMDLDISSTNGSLTVSGCSGMLKLRTTNGKISGEEISGSVEAKTTNGAIEMEMFQVNPSEELSLRTTNGSIRLYLPEKINADLRAKTTNGSIRCELPLEEGFSKSRYLLEGSINDGGPLIYLKTTNGSIKVLEK